MTAVLSVENLGVSFGGIHAVNSVSFSAEPNAITTAISRCDGRRSVANAAPSSSAQPLPNPHKPASSHCGTGSPARLADAPA